MQSFSADENEEWNADKTFFSELATGYIDRKKVSSWCANPKGAMCLAAASANMQSERIGARLLRDAIKERKTYQLT